MGRPGRPGKPVYKYNSAGEVIDRSPSVLAACEKAQMSETYMHRHIKTGAVINGARYSFSGDGLLPVVEPKEEVNRPWEKNGMFCISGWSEVCY